MHRSNESRLLALALGAAAGAQLARMRVLDSMVPDWLAPLRREIEVVSGGVQLAGAASLCVPALRQGARWANVGVQVGVLAGALENARHPERFRRCRTWGIRSLITPVRIPIHIGIIGLILWVTRGSAREHVPGVHARLPMRPTGDRLTGAVIDDDAPDTEPAAEQA